MTTANCMEIDALLLAFSTVSEVKTLLEWLDNDDLENCDPIDVGEDGKPEIITVKHSLRMDRDVISFYQESIDDVIDRLSEFEYKAITVSLGFVNKLLDADRYMDALSVIQPLWSTIGTEIGVQMNPSYGFTGWGR